MFSRLFWIGQCEAVFLPHIVDDEKVDDMGEVEDSKIDLQKNLEALNDANNSNIREKTKQTPAKNSKHCDECEELTYFDDRIVDIRLDL